MLHSKTIIMRYLFFLIFLTASLVAQDKKTPANNGTKNDGNFTSDKILISKDRKKAPIDWYRVITIENDTTYIDTTLTIQKDYIYNYLRKDNFGLMPFANEGQTYNTLYFGLNSISPYPEFGFEAKHFNYLQSNQIKYYSVPTPLTELYFKTVMQQGQSLDAFITLNTSERFNFSLAYKGLRSLGRFVNQLSSTGNFRFTTSYNTKNNRYFLKTHFTAQDILNAENGGIINIEDFESENIDFKDRSRLQVYFTDAQSLLKGNRYFIDHNLRINKEGDDNNIYVKHQFSFENKFFEYRQPTVNTTVTNQNGTTSEISRFGSSYVNNNIVDKTRYNKLYNKVGVVYENKILGEFQFFADDFNYSYYYNAVIVNNSGTITNNLNDRINTVGGQYKYQKNNWNGNFQYSSSISKQSLSNLDLFLSYDLDQENQFSFQFQKANKLPNHIYNLHQSSYISYNWQNDFKNEKINNIEVKANTKWATATLQFSSLGDKLYFDDDNPNKDTLSVSPKQYDKTINYIALKIAKEFKFGKFALDNTILYQKVDQQDHILNVPDFVTRNTFYYSDYVFKKAMYLQTGVTFNYFTSYFANDYNPLIGEFYIQNQKKIGQFPMFDFFINAKIKQTRIYLKAEHFNSAFTGNNFYSAPNYPYRDFLIRFGLVWNFFQ